MLVRSLGQGDPLEEDMATHSSVLAWKIPWIEDPGRLQSMGSQRVGRDRAHTHMHTHTHTHTLTQSAKKDINRQHVPQDVIHRGRSIISELFLAKTFNLNWIMNKELNKPKQKYLTEQLAWILQKCQCHKRKKKKKTGLWNCSRSNDGKRDDIHIKMQSTVLD